VKPAFQLCAAASIGAGGDPLGAIETHLWSKSIARRPHVAWVLRAQIQHWYPARTRSQLKFPPIIRLATQINIGADEWRISKKIHEILGLMPAFGKLLEFFCRNNYDCFFARLRDVLRSFRARTPKYLAEPGFGSLQLPARTARGPRRFLRMPR